MNKPCTCLFSVLNILLVFACLGVPARAVAQVHHEYCYNCRPWEEDKEYYKCSARTEADSPWGSQVCKLSRGGKQCATSAMPNGGPDCMVVSNLAGRVSPDVESEPWPQAVGGTEFPRRVQQAASAVDDLIGVARHECTGAIIRRRYSSARIAELHSGLRRVTI